MSRVLPHPLPEEAEISARTLNRAVPDYHKERMKSIAKHPDDETAEREAEQLSRPETKKAA